MDWAGRVFDLFDLRPALRGWHRPHGNYESPQQGLQPRAVARRIVEIERFKLTTDGRAQRR